jgi:ribosome-binding factor A
VGFATVTEVETSADLAHARVWVSVIGSPEERQRTIEALQRAMPFIRRELGKRLRIRRIPQFSVRLDESIERGSRVIHILNELEAGLDPGAAPPGESLPTPAPRLPLEGDAPLEAMLAGLSPSPRGSKVRSGPNSGTTARLGGGADARRTSGNRRGPGAGPSTGRRTGGRSGHPGGSGGSGKPGTRHEPGSGS